MTDMRVRRLREELDGAGLAGMVVSDRTDLAWLTGFTGSSGTAVVTATALTLVTDARYRMQVATQAPDVEVVIERRTAVAVAGVLGLVTGRIGLQTDVLTADAHDELVAALADDAPGVEPVSSGRVISELRRVKDETELTAMARACAVSVTALQHLLDGDGTSDGAGLTGRTERAIVRELDGLLIDAGADEVAFATMVASGPHSASPHHEATDRPLTAGDLVVLDFGARVDGYNADMTRTVFVGGPERVPPAPWQRELHTLVARANAAGRAAATPGADLARVDAAARELIAAAGYGDHFEHGLGHGIGRAVHEAPLLRAGVTGSLAAGEVVTIEPGVYLSGRGGVRIEDTVVLRDGAEGPRVLTTAPRDLLVLG